MQRTELVLRRSLSLPLLQLRPSRPSTCRISDKRSKTSRSRPGGYQDGVSRPSDSSGQILGAGATSGTSQAFVWSVRLDEPIDEPIPSTGASSSSLKATPTGNQTTWCRSTSTTPTPNQHQRAGTPAPSSPSRSRIPTTLPSSPSLVIPPFPAHLRRRVAEPHRLLTQQMHTTGSSTRNAIGASPASPTSGSFTPRKKVTLARRLRETRWMLRPLCGY